MAVKLITAAANYPVTVTEAKAHLRVDFTDDDALIGALLAAATAHAERFLGRALVDQIWELTLDEFPDAELEIPLPPLIEVVSVKYDNAAGDEQTLDAADYVVDVQSEPGWIVPANNSWPSIYDGINAVRIRFRAGYLNSDSPPTDNVPADIKAAILMYLGTLYANRETMVIGQTATQMPWASEQLLRPHRVNLGMA